MKRKWVVIGTLAVALSGAIWSVGQPKPGMSTKEFMREKLAHSQKVLEGLAMEDYFTIQAESKKLSAMTQEATWQAFQNPDYAQHSAIFRRHANALMRAAQDKNLDAATLAYVRLTMSCVDCHKLVRGKLIAQAP